MAWERFYTAKSLEDTGKTVDEVEWSRRPDLTFYFLDAKGDKVQIDPEDGSFSPMWVPMSTCRFLLNSCRSTNSVVRNAMAANAAVDDEEVAEEKFGNAADKFIKGLKLVDAGLKECAKVSGRMAILLDKYPTFFDGGASSFRRLLEKLFAAESTIESFMSRM